MSEPNLSRPKRNIWRFAVILIVIVIIALPVLMVLSSLAMMSSLGAPRGFLADRAEWPKALNEAFADTQSIEIYGLAQFMDERVIAQVQYEPVAVLDLICTHELEPTTSSHPSADKLLSSIPGKWPKWSSSPDDRWYATKDYGTVYMEGQDLLILVTNDKTGRTLIHFEWIF